MIEKLLDEYTKSDCAVAFSGGVDSALLLYLAVKAAKNNGSRVFAVTVKTALHPAPEEEEARRAAALMGAEYVKLEINELDLIRNNPPDRCYICKKNLFLKIKELAKGLGADVVMDGTNADDTKTYRPGIRALLELDIKSPLKEAGLCKDEIRKMAQKYGITAAKKPSMPCLATRFPYDVRLDEEAMSRVWQAEEYIRSLGFYNVRARVHDDVLRLEVDSDDICRLAHMREEIVNKMKRLGYGFVTVDLEGYRSGCYDKGGII